jgi:hypothetical protein
VSYKHCNICSLLCLFVKKVFYKLKPEIIYSNNFRQISKNILNSLANLNPDPDWMNCNFDFKTNVFPAVFLILLFTIKTLNPDPDSLEMLDPDPDSMNQDPATLILSNFFRKCFHIGSKACSNHWARSHPER